ncbi:MAG: cyclic nucleotide-binding domain-containing protein [Myxococcota bacterium]
MEWFAHFANIFILCSFLVRSILWLRLLSILAGLMLVPYYLYGVAQPLWVPLLWNSLFMAINSVQVVLIVLARRPVRLDGGQRELYELAFLRLSPRQFLTLYGLARIRRVEPGRQLVEQGSPLDELLFLLEGEVRVHREGEANLLRIQRGRFVGEMSFLTGELPCAHVFASCSTRLVAWPRIPLEALLRQDPELRTEMQVILGSDLAAKLRD